MSTFRKPFIIVIERSFCFKVLTMCVCVCVLGMKYYEKNKDGEKIPRGRRKRKIRMLLIPHITRDTQDVKKEKQKGQKIKKKTIMFFTR